MSTQLVPFRFQNGPLRLPLSQLDADLDYVSGKVVSVKDHAFGAKGDGFHDDTAALNAAFAFASTCDVWMPAGTYLVSSALIVPSDARIRGSQRDRTIILRTPTHVQDTMIVGSDPAAPAGSFQISNITFQRNVLFNGGHQYNPGVSTSIDNKLVGSQAHLRVNVGQGSLINNCVFNGTPFGIALIGCSTTTIRGCNVNSSIWDQLTAGLQEGIAAILLTESSSGGACTLISIEGRCVIGGGYNSAPRNVTIGTIVAVIAENVGGLNGIAVNGCEGLFISNSYIGGQNSNCIQFAANSATIMTNVEIAGCFFDGARSNCILFDHTNAAGATTMVVINGNRFNGEEACGTHIFAQDTLGAPSLFQAVISNNTMMATNFAAMIIRGGVGIGVKNNSVCGYNVRGGNTGDPSGSAGLQVVLGAASSDKVFTANNEWGGAIGTLSGTNNCQWGVFFGGAAPTANGSSGERNNGLGLGGGALVNIAQTYPV